MAEPTYEELLGSVPSIFGREATPSPITTGAPAAPAPSGPSNPVSALGAGLYEGLTRVIPEMAGQAASYAGERTGLGPVGKPLTDWADQTPEAPPTDWTSEQFYSAGKNLVPSVGLGPGLYGAGKVLSMFPNPYVKGAGQLLSGASKYLAPILFGASQAGQTLETAKKAGQPAGLAPELTGAAEGLGEFFGTKYLGRLFGIGKEGVKPSMKEFGKELLLRGMPVEVGTEMGQQGVQAAIEKLYGIRPEAQPFQEALQTIAPTIIMTGLTGAAGAPGAYRASQIQQGIDQAQAAERIRAAFGDMFPAPPTAEQPAPFPPAPGAMQPGAVFTPPTLAEVNQSLIDVISQTGREQYPATFPAPPVVRTQPWAPEPTPPEITAQPPQSIDVPGMTRESGYNQPDANQVLMQRLARLRPGIFPEVIAPEPVVPGGQPVSLTERNQKTIEREFTPPTPTLAERNQQTIDQTFGETKRPVPAAPVDLTTPTPTQLNLTYPTAEANVSQPADVFAALQPQLSEAAPEMTMTMDGLAVTPRDWSDENLLIGQLGAVPNKAGQLVIPNDKLTTTETTSALLSAYGRTAEEEANMISEAERQQSKEAARVNLESTLADFKGNKRLKATSDEFRAMVHSEYPDLAKKYVVPKPSKAFGETPMPAQATPMEQISLFPPEGKPMAKPKAPVEEPMPTEAYHWSDQPRKVIKGFGAKGVEGKLYSGQKRDMQDRDSRYTAPPVAAGGMSARKIASIARYEPYSDWDLGRTPEKQVPGEAWHGGGKFVHVGDITGYYDGNKDPNKLWSKTNEIMEANPQLHRRNVFAGLVKDAGFKGYVLNIDPADPSKGRWASGFGQIAVKRVVPAEQFRKETADEEARKAGGAGPGPRFAYGNAPTNPEAGAPAGAGPSPTGPAAQAGVPGKETFQADAQKVGFSYDGPFPGLPGRAPFQQFTDQETGSTWLMTPDETFDSFVKRVAPNKATFTIKDEGISLEEAINKANAVFESVQKEEPIVDFEWSTNVAANIQRKLPAGMYVKVVETPLGLPADAQRRLREDLAETVPFGWYDPPTNTAYVINSALQNKDQIYEVIAHELIGHMGVWNLLGRDYTNTLLDIYEGLSPEQKAEVEQYGFDENRPLGRLGIAEEYIAYLAETGQNPGLLKQIISLIRQGLRALGINVKWSDNDIRVQILARTGHYLFPGKSAFQPYWGLKVIGNDGVLVATSLDVTQAYVDHYLGHSDGEQARMMVVTKSLDKAFPSSPPVEVDYLVDGKQFPQLKDLPKDPNVQKLWSAVSAVVRSHLDPSRAYMGLNKGMVEAMLSNKPSLSGDANAAWTDLQNFYAKTLMSKRTVKVETVPTNLDERAVRFMAKKDPNSPLRDEDIVKAHLVPYMTEAKRQIDLVGDLGLQAWIINNRPTVAGELKRQKQEIAKIIDEYRKSSAQEGPPTKEQIANWQAEVAKSREITKRFRDAVTAYKKTMIDAIREQKGKTEVRPQGRPEFTVNGEQVPVATSDSQAVQAILARLNRFLNDMSGASGVRSVPFGNRILAQKAIESAIRKARGGQLGTFKPTFTSSSMQEINQLEDWYHKHFGRVNWSAPRRSVLKNPDVRLQPAGQFMVKKVKDFPVNPMAKGSETTEPNRGYVEAPMKGTGNVWVRQSMTEDNKGRQLMVQFSTHLINKDATPGDDSSYYDALYSGSRPGYDRLHDFWEVPQWMGFASHFLPNADVYVVRNIPEAIKFFNEAGYDRLMFSAIDVNTSLIKQVADGYKGQIDVGGYTKPDAFNQVPNIKWHDSMKDFAKSIGAEYTEGTDYRHFTEGKVIPRLTMSQGCLHKCAFCTVPKKLEEAPADVIMQQAKSFSALKGKLVYLNDKTFGQAKNYRLLSDVYKQMKQDNPDFEGFIIQTTAAQIAKMDNAWLKQSGIKYVEMGVESYNDLILADMNKPHREAHIDKAMEKLRRADIQVIPNIIIGMPGETGATYARTLDFLARNKDIISHANIYNLAIYNDTALSKKISAADANDLDENVRAKSFHTDKQIHDDFAISVFNYGKNQLTSKGIKPATSGEQTASVSEGIKTPGIEDVSGPGKFMVKKASKEPKKTIVAYKLLRTMKKRAGDLFPLFIKKSDPVPQGKWVQGEYVPTKGFAKRPGWHAGSLPYAPHLMRKDGTMMPNRVWTEVEMPDDVDYTEAARLAGKKGLQEVPVDGHYRFKPAKNQGKEWLIGGAVKINRILTPEEVDEINRKGGVGKAMAKKEPTQLITKPVREFAKSLQQSVREGVREIQNKVAARKDWPFVEGDRIRAPNGNVFEITARSWNTRTDKPQYHVKGISPDISTMRTMLNETAETRYTLLSGPRGTAMTKKATKEPTKIVSEDADVEARWQKAYERQGDLWERLKTWAKETASEIKAQTTRHFKDLDPKKDGEIIEVLRQQETVPSIAAERAGEHLRRIQDSLGDNPEDARAYERIVILRDLVREIEVGKLNGSETLPFGYKSLDAVKADLAKFEGLAGDKVKKTLDLRDDYFKRLVDLAKRHKVLSDKATDKNYFHHQVSLYQALQGNYVGGPRELRRTTKSFQRKRTGSVDDYNTNYFTAEHDVVSGLITQIETARTIEALQNSKANKLNEMVEKAKAEGLELKEALKKYYPGYRLFNTERNPLFRRRISLVDQDVRATQELAGVTSTEFEEPSDLDQLQAQAQVSDVLLVPDNVADALENFRPDQNRQDNVMSAFAGETLKLWKQWVLFNPMRVVRYSFNNATGDSDVVFAYRPEILRKYAVQAAKDLFQWNYGSVEANSELWKELGKWRRKGLLNSGITINEIPNLSDSRLLNAIRNPDQAFVGRYFQSVKKFNNYRENILRLATARYMMDKMNAGKETELAFAASRPAEVQAIPKAVDRAAKMARELVGDYGNVSYLGQRLSRYVIPFWSWMEINAPRYMRMMRNELKYGGGAGGRMTGMAAWSGTKLAAKMMGLAAAVSLWNATFFPDDDDEFRRTGRDQLHLLLGRNEDGSIRSVRLQGAFSDMMSWIAMEHLPQAIQKIVSGQKPFDEAMKEAFTAPVKKAIGGAVPLFKGPFEAMIGKTTFPEPFNPRPIRDKWQHLFRSFGLEAPYNWLAGKPSTPGPLDDLKKMFIYDTDPGEASYYWAVGKVNKYLEDLGQPKAGGAPTPRSNALYYYKLAVRKGDKDAQARYLKEYLDLSKGKTKGIDQSLKQNDPRVMVPVKLRRDFLKSLSGDDQKTWKAAVAWYQKNQSEVKAAARRPAEEEED